MILPALFVGGLFYVTITRTPDAPQQLVVEGEALGTTWVVKSVEVYTPESEQALRTVVEGALAEVDVQMSTYREDSDLMVVNQSQSTEPMTIKSELSAVLSESLQIGSRSQGAFDVTVGPLVRAWGFGPDSHRVPPEADALDGLKSMVGQDKLELDGSQLRKSHPEVEIDLSAIAKGYAVDLIVSRLEASGRTDLMAEVGGEIVARGLNPQGNVWRLGIEKPTENDRTVYEVVELKDAAMATSGDYRNYYEVDGQRVSHLIDPRTMQPITHRLASVTVIAPKCSTADGWATALSVMGEKEGLALANELGVAALFIVRDAGGMFSTQSSTSFDALK